MPTECNPNLFAFAPAEGRAVVASFDGGAITSDAGALLLGATDRVLGLTRRLAACFKDSRDPAYTEHALETLVMQRVVGIALGYEDLNDHDQLRHDPVLATLANKLTAISTPPMTRCTGNRKAGSSMATTTATVTCRSPSSVAGTCWQPSCAARTSMARPGRWRKLHALLAKSAPAGRGFGSCCAPTAASAARR